VGTVPIDDPDWRELARDVYRAAHAELLDRWQGLQPHLVEIFKEDLREALLDLKQAVIEDRAGDALNCLQEVTMLLTELRCRSPGG
jgi:hypothetical protein